MHFNLPTDVAVAEQPDGFSFAPKRVIAAPSADELEQIVGLGAYPLWHAARAELLLRLGRTAEASAGLRAALELEPAGPVRDHLAQQLAGLPPA